MTKTELDLLGRLLDSEDLGVYVHGAMQERTAKRLAAQLPGQLEYFPQLLFLQAKRGRLAANLGKLAKL